jgi:hypothetical protein
MSLPSGESVLEYRAISVYALPNIVIAPGVSLVRPLRERHRENNTDCFMAVNQKPTAMLLAQGDARDCPPIAIWPGMAQFLLRSH